MSFLSHMDSSLDEPETLLRTAAEKIVQKITQNGHIALYAGGWVRDYVMKKPSNDIDIATSASSDFIIFLFPKAILVGMCFGVVRVIVDGYQFEIATFRKDGVYKDGRHPESITLISSPQEDALRRDFTINGLFFDPMCNRVLDYVGGLDDIDNKVIKTIGSPSERFSEDKLRILRAIRFKNSFRFTIDDATWQAILKFAPSTFEHISVERIWQELDKMRQKKVLGVCLQDFFTSSLLYYFFPHIHTLDQKEITQRIFTICRCEENVLLSVSTALLISLLFPLQEYEQKLQLFYRFKLSNSDLKALQTSYAIEKQIEASFFSLSERERVQLYSLPFSQEIFLLFSHFDTYDVDLITTCLQEQKTLFFWIEQLITKKLFVTGQDFIDHGIAPGPLIGKLVEDAFTYSLTFRDQDKNNILCVIMNRLSTS